MLKDDNTAEELLLGECSTEVKVGGNTCRDQQSGRSSMRTIRLYFGL